MPKQTSESVKQRHRTVPIPETMARVPGYPRKLVVFRIPASSFYWVRYYLDGKIFKRSTQSEKLREALEFAKQFYDELNFRKHQGLLTLHAAPRFESLAVNYLKAEEAKVARGDLSRITYGALEQRLTKYVLPFFGRRELGNINYQVLQEFINELSAPDKGLSPFTIRAYVGIVKKILQMAVRQGSLTFVPEIPLVRVRDNPREWFTQEEYEKLHRKAKTLIDQPYEWVKQRQQDGSHKTVYQPKGTPRNGELVRAVTVSHDLYELLLFMTNSFVRPTDIKNMQHKHIDVVRGQHKFLRLRLPPSKGHTNPITTMPNAVTYYERLKAHHAEKGLAKADNYVFLPQHENREYALQKLTEQFDLVAALADLKIGPSGKPRSLYSLRHTCIMLRLMKAEGMDLKTLAANARTSVEMIDRFYARPLQGEMNIEVLQSHRGRARRNVKNLDA